MADLSLPREDLSERRSEGFRPPAHWRPAGPPGRLLLVARRLVDLQYGSIHRDLARLLPRVQGCLADVGCGAQPFRDLLPGGVRYIGVDIASSQSKFGYRAPDTRYFEGDILPLQDAEASCILCTETLEHVLRPEVLLAELARALASDGHLILTVPFAARWHFIPHDYWRFTPSALRHLLSQAGFRDIRIHARGGALAVAGYKALGWVLQLLSGGGGPRLGNRILGLLMLPLAGVAALAGNLGLVFPGTTDDTLGYTVLAVKGEAP